MSTDGLDARRETSSPVTDACSNDGGRRRDPAWRAPRVVNVLFHPDEHFYTSSPAVHVFQYAVMERMQIQ